MTSLSRNQLTCRPPPVQPAARGPSPSDTPEVVVIVGGNLRFVIGKLSYESPNSGEGQLPKSVIIGVTIGNPLLFHLLIPSGLIGYPSRDELGCSNPIDPHPIAVGSRSTQVFQSG